MTAYKLEYYFSFSNFNNNKNPDGIISIEWYQRPHVKISEIYNEICEKENVKNVEVFKIDNATINSRITYDNCGLKMFIWNNCDFHENFEFIKINNYSFTFNKCHIRRDINLNNKIFNSDLNFINSTFNGDVNSQQSEFKGNVSFKYAYFKYFFQFTGSKVLNGIADFEGANFNNNGYFYEAKFKIINLKFIVVTKDIYFLDCEINKGNRETFRLVKNQFLAQNNKITSLVYYAKEMRAYKRELELLVIHKPIKSVLTLFKNSQKPITNLDNEKLIKSTKYIPILALTSNLYKTINSSEWNIQNIYAKTTNYLTHLFNLIILYFNWITNNFGRSWIQGLIVLTLTIFVLFWWFIKSLQGLNEGVFLDLIDNQSLFTRYYLNFLNPTKQIEIKNLYSEIYDNHNNITLIKSNKSHIIEYLTRIVSSLGIYQTIQAFRKFKSK